MCEKDSAHFLLQTDCPIEDYWLEASKVIDEGESEHTPTELHLAHLVAELVMEVGIAWGFSVPEDLVAS